MNPQDIRLRALDMARGDERPAFTDIVSVLKRAAAYAEFVSTGTFDPKKPAPPETTTIG